MSNIPTPEGGHKPPALKLPALILAALAICVVVAGIVTRNNHHAQLVQQAKLQMQPVVKVIHPVLLDGAGELVLPGTLQAFYSAKVYARVSGYLKQWVADIGTNVKSGQLLATIETPELDQQLKQSEANLDTALANLNLSEITAKRWQNLLKTDSVSRQEADEKQGDYVARQALVAAARADVERLRALESFKNITAPFDGIVTGRNTDIGALINAGHDSGHELFTVDDVHRLRLYVEVPQSYAHRVATGTTAEFTIPGLPGQRFSAQLTGNSRAVNSTTGTMLIELQVDNAAHNLLPGGYGEVRLALARTSGQIQIPVSALVFRRDGMTVATLDSENRVQFRPIQIGQDHGSTVEVLTGLAAADRVIDSPPDSLEQGDLVRIAEGPAK